MKLFTKISLIVAAVAGGLGILAIIIGLVMGADVYDLNDMGIHISPQQLELNKGTCDFRDIKRLEVDVQNAQITIFATDNEN